MHGGTDVDADLNPLSPNLIRANDVRATRRPHIDWPDYGRVTEGHEVVDHARNEYAALVSMCDHSLGRVMDAMDEHNMWDDTMLIVCTDHGFLLGEHGWWGKNIQPWFDETIHTPLFIWDPRSRVAGEHRDELVQTVDFAPTLLDFFGVPATPDMQGKPLGETVADDTRVREAALFGSFGGHICVGDGRYVYMRASVDASNQPLTEHTLMPTAMRGFPSLDALSAAELHPGFSFTKNVPLLRYPGQARPGPFTFGTLLFDLLTDPEQTTPLIDDDIELRMATRMRDLMIATDAPAEQYVRVGLPEAGENTEEHLLVRTHWAQVLASTEPPPETSSLPAMFVRPLTEALANEDCRRVLEEAAPALVHGRLVAFIGDLSLMQIAAMLPNVLPANAVRAAADEIGRLSEQQT